MCRKMEKEKVTPWTNFLVNWCFRINLSIAQSLALPSTLKEKESLLKMKSFLNFLNTNWYRNFGNALKNTPLVTPCPNSKQAYSRSNATWLHSQWLTDVSIFNTCIKDPCFLFNTNQSKGHFVWAAWFVYVWPEAQTRLFYCQQPHLTALCYLDIQMWTYGVSFNIVESCNSWGTG